MKNEKETRQALEKIQLDLKHYCDNHNSIFGNAEHREHITFLKDTIRAIKFILEDEL